MLQVLEMQGDLEPCETVDDFLDVYGLWDMRDEFDYHRCLASGSGLKF